QDKSQWVKKKKKGTSFYNMEESEHTLSTTVKTNIQMEESGLGLILIQNGPYIQVSGLVENSAASRDGKLQAGDTLLKIGHANVLGWTLRELRQLLHNTPIGTVLQIQVYRDFMKLPFRWSIVMDNIPEVKGTETDYTCEEAWTSSEDSDDDDPATHRGPTWISKDWHIFERKTYTFTVGSDIGCDIMIHKDFDDDSNLDSVSVSYVSSSSPYWTMPKGRVEESSSTSSTVSDAFWLENFAYEFE
uniref:PDZ domain containing 9 n=1 Tax=Salvator merianae TaxID=96440 RepID=A0A8D0E347_SALMN